MLGKIQGSQMEPADLDDIIYHTNDKERSGWYTFTTLPDPYNITGTSIRIRNNSKKPWIFVLYRRVWAVLPIHAVQLLLQNLSLRKNTA